MRPHAVFCAAVEHFRAVCGVICADGLPIGQKVWYNPGMKRLIDCAAKRVPCDLVIVNARIYNVFTGKEEAGELAVADGMIVGVGNGYRGNAIWDARGSVLLPALIDSHIHAESSMLAPEAFAELCVLHGTGAVVADPHEIVNVCGIPGAEYMAEAVSRLQVGGKPALDVFLQLPSCVPATPFETSGAAIDARETRSELSRELFFGLGEMMNYPAVAAGEEETLKKLSAAADLNKIVDGHAPGLTGAALCTYRCAGIVTDHESLSAEECREKIARGMYVQLRCGSSACNAVQCAAAMDACNFHRFLLCSDDKNARDLMRRGHMDDALRRLVAAGVPAHWAICAATLNAAACYGLKDRGALAPGYRADIVAVDDIVGFNVRAVLKGGTFAVRDGEAYLSCERPYLPAFVRDTVHMRLPSAASFCLNIAGGKARAMRVQPHGLVTEQEVVAVRSADGDVVLQDGLAKLAVIERHFAGGGMGLGLVAGYGLRGGAIGITVAHDSHNLVVLGDDNAAMARVAQLLQQAGGGMALVRTDGTEEVFALEIAGLMSAQPADVVARETERLSRLAHEMGVKACYEPFMTLAFLALPVIPHLKLTDRGLFDVDAFAFIKVEV